MFVLRNSEIFVMDISCTPTRNELYKYGKISIESF